MTARPERRPEASDVAAAAPGKPRVRKFRLRPDQPLAVGLRSYPVPA